MSPVDPCADLGVRSSANSDAGTVMGSITQPGQVHDDLARLEHTVVKEPTALCVTRPMPWSVGGSAAADARLVSVRQPLMLPGSSSTDG